MIQFSLLLVANLHSLSNLPLVTSSQICTCKLKSHPKTSSERTLHRLSQSGVKLPLRCNLLMRRTNNKFILCTYFAPYSLNEEDQSYRNAETPHTPVVVFRRCCSSYSCKFQASIRFARGEVDRGFWVLVVGGRRSGRLWERGGRLVFK